MPQLKYTTGEGRNAVFELRDRPIVVGRLTKCDIVVSKPTVSRRHARIFKRDRRWVIADEGSSHGTLVNGIWISEKVLEAGDRIRIGPAVISYLESSGEKTEEIQLSTFRPPTGPVVEEPTSPGTRRSKRKESHEIIVEHAVDSGDLYKTMASARLLDVTKIIENPMQAMAEMAPPIAPPLSPQPTLEIRSVRPEPPRTFTPAAPPDVATQLLTLVRISDELRRCTDIDEVCKTAVDMVATATKANRGVLALVTPEGGYVPKYQRMEGHTAPESDVQVSSTFVDRMMSKRVALIALDTGLDESLASARSVVALNIRSILCSPLWDGEEILGYLYLDTINLDHRFGKSDLDFVSTVAYQTASEIARLNLLDRIRKEEERRRNLARFFTPDVIQLIDEEASAGRLDPTQSAREQMVTVIFTDIRGFTALSERLSPAEVKRLLDDYFDRMSEIIVDRYQGTLDKYIGDGIMALFGAPFSEGLENDAQRAVAAAVSMRDELAQLRGHLNEFHDIEVRIGINTGRVVAGWLGSSRRLEYSVIGDAVNVASRLEGSAEPGTIQIGESTYKLVKGVFKCKFAGERRVKNRAQPVRAYTVLRSLSAK